MQLEIPVIEEVQAAIILGDLKGRGLRPAQGQGKQDAVDAGVTYHENIAVGGTRGLIEGRQDPVGQVQEAFAPGWPKPGEIPAVGRVLLGEALPDLVKGQASPRSPGRFPETPGGPRESAPGVQR